MLLGIKTLQQLVYIYMCVYIEVQRVPVEVRSPSKRAFFISKSHVPRRVWQVRAYIRTNNTTGLDYGGYSRANGEDQDDRRLWSSRVTGTLRL